MATYIVARTHIVDTRGTYCRPKAYIVDGDDNIDTYIQTNETTIYALNFDTSCRRRHNIPSTLKQIVDENY